MVQSAPYATVAAVTVPSTSPPGIPAAFVKLPPTSTHVYVQPPTIESRTVPATAQPEASPTRLLPTRTPTPAPAEIIPDFIQEMPAQAVYLDTPPTTVDCGRHGLLLQSRFPSEIKGPWRAYHAYLPPCYGEDGRSYPTLYLFHGSIQNDSHWVDLGIVNHVETGIREGRYPPFMIIMPNNGQIGNNTSGNEHSIEGITVKELIPFVDRTFCTWDAAAGRSIGGISRGGYWALMIAFRHTDLFTAVSGHSSQLRYETDRAAYNPLSTYAEADLSNMRIWLDWGKIDFLRSGQAQLRDALQEISVNLEVHVNGGGHNDQYWLVHVQEYLDWHTAQWPLDRAEYPLCDQS